MSILTNDISKLGGCLVGDFFEVEVTSLNEKDYDLAYSRVYGREDAVMARKESLQKFENYMWTEPKDDAALRNEIECMPMPDTHRFLINDYIAHGILDVIKSKLTKDMNIGYGRQVRGGVINCGATYMFRDDSMFTVQLVRVRLFEK